jgi:hypothetical protein
MKIDVDIPCETKMVEISSLINKIEKQYITGGETLQDLILEKLSKEGKTNIKPKAYMEAQRGYTWEKWRASNFIYSVMRHKHIPEIMLYREDHKSQYWKTLDGQQRLTTLWKFINNQFPLDMKRANFNHFVLDDKEYSINDLEGKRYSDLPQEWQDRILSQSQNVTYLSDCSDRQAEDVYTEMANGTKSLKPVEIRKAAMGIEVRNFVYSFLSGSWPFHVMTTSSARGNMGLDITSQFFALLKANGAIKLDKDNVDKVIFDLRDKKIPESIKTKTLATRDYLNKATDIMTNIKKETDKQRKTGRKTKDYNKYRFQIFKNKTYILMFLWAGNLAAQSQIDIDKFANWTINFFKKPSELFKKGLAGRGSKAGDLINVSKRIKAIEIEIDKLKKDNSEVQVEGVAQQIEQTDNKQLQENLDDKTENKQITFEKQKFEEKIE